ncbi:hypothetical protein CIL03_11280 [Virgibacillus indicus]|uniref:Uncharacterized protein n=1 Tax=Virgibacillus indicus TaxID=2024554 RepID=A0A265N9V2_9BACI|nr:ABC-three component system middle component 1 [Virgibacillus indicus]OZU88229.1 hypothetical protein CIL03_11280 [Virgibacillus indicus]
MKNILKKAFLDYGYEVSDLSYNVLFSEINGQEYFLTTQYDVNELINFFDLPKTNEIIEAFEKKQLEKSDIKKNTTLFVYIETDNLKSFYEQHKNTIFQIEEDEYFFRKHVIVYSKNGIQNINPNHNISEQLHKILKSDGGIDRFEKNYYDDEEFFIAIQLMAKLPFLIIKSDEEPYESLLEKVNKQSEIINLMILIDGMDVEESSDYFDQLEDDILSEEINTPKLSDFFQRFEENTE